jgi:Four helix bundle sensory module for signal transduction
MYDRMTFSSLDQSIASIYKDRLMPATYIFQLTDRIYQKRLRNNTGEQNNSGKLNEEHDKAISEIIKAYETTYFTTAEKEQWVAFKQALNQYNTLNTAAIKNEEVISNSFNKVLQYLQALSRIQANEGNQLFSSSKSNVSGMIIISQLELALLLILGILALILVSINNNRLMRIQNPRLN